jgi:hypothetical protein
MLSKRARHAAARRIKHLAALTAASPQSYPQIGRESEKSLLIMYLLRFLEVKPGFSPATRQEQVLA